MSTIKSSSEHLTLNADGASKDIKFQANGVEKASISSTGAFTSTTIDATKLTGNLPAIDGSSLTGVGGGKVLQVVLGTDTSQTTVATTTWTDVGLSATITPASGTKVLIQWTQQANPESTEGFGIRLLRNSTVIYTTGDAISDQYQTAGGQIRMRSVFYDLDTHGADGNTAITYKIQVASYLSASINFNVNGTNTEILLMEINS